MESMTKNPFDMSVFINTREEKENPIDSPCVGIFWLSNDCSELTDITGFQKFTKKDLQDKSYIQPQGGHHLYTFPRDQPRGRLEVGNGLIKIYLGEDFPKELENTVKEQVIKWFKLDEFRDLIKMVYHYHWNTKDAAGH